MKKIKAARKRIRISDEVITIDVLKNGMRQKSGKRNDYTLTQISRNVFRIKML